MRLLLALCAVAGGTLCGSAMSGGARRRVRTLESAASGIKLMRVHMIGMFQPVSHALSAAECPLLEAVGEAMAPGVSASEAWTMVRDRERRRGGRLDALTPEDLAALDRLFSGLGESGLDQQKLLLSETIGMLDRSLENARSRSGDADHLYVPLGALTGLMAALVVI